MRRLVAASLLLLASSALAQTTNKEKIFGSGKPPVFKEEDLDRKFLKSKLNRALTSGTTDANCQQLVAGMLEALASTSPLFHRRDENFYLDPGITNALQTQLSTAGFPATNFLAAMVRRVHIEGKMPPEWMNTATELMKNRTIDDTRMPIDLARLRALADQLRPIDSFWYTLPSLQSLYEMEVRRATTVSANAADFEFRDTYLDRDVAWQGLTLVDISPQRLPPPKKTKGSRPPVEDEAPAIVAHFAWAPADPHRSQLMVFAKKMTEVVTHITARLAEPQYVVLSQQSRGKRMLVKGRLWDMNKEMTEFEIRDAYIFDDPDTSQGVFLAEPQAVARCPLAVNDLSGLAPRQPGGFGQH